MNILSDAQVQQIQARHPVKISVSVKKKLGRPPSDVSECWHWCSVGRHDWMHRLPKKLLASELDEWEQICPAHKQEVS
jgi:hypothetical protein